MPEKRLVLHLLIRMILVLWAATALVFCLLHLAPGDPAEIILSAQSETASPQKVAELRERMGLNRPLAEQYAAWLGRMACLDLGRSYRSGEAVTTLIWSRLTATVELALTTLVFLVVFSILTGAVAALQKDGMLDHGGRWLTIVIQSIPGYWLGLLLIYIFSLRLGIFPIFGRGGAVSLVLPTVTLGLAAAMGQGRILRAALLEIMSRDYILFARVKGISNKTLFFRHILKNALPPVLTLWGTSFGRLLGGAVLVESVFAWPGLGRLTVEAVISRDIPVVQGTVLFMAVAFVVVNTGVDLLCSMANPRLTEGRAHRRTFL